MDASAQAVQMFHVAITLPDKRIVNAIGAGKKHVGMDLHQTFYIVSVLSAHLAGMEKLLERNVNAHNAKIKCAGMDLFSHRRTLASAQIAALNSAGMEAQEVIQNASALKSQYNALRLHAPAAMPETLSIANVHLATIA